MTTIGGELSRDDRSEPRHRPDDSQRDLAATAAPRNDIINRYRKDKPCQRPRIPPQRRRSWWSTIRDDTNFAEFAALRDDKQQQLEVLRSDGRIGAHYVSPARRATFIEVIAADEQQVGETLATLPFARFFNAEVYPTTPPDAAEAAHRARS